MSLTYTFVRSSIIVDFDPSTFELTSMILGSSVISLYLWCFMQKTLICFFQRNFVHSLYTLTQNIYEYLLIVSAS